MKEFEIAKSHVMKVYDNTDYVEKNKEVNDCFVNILSSYEYDNESYDINKARDYVEDLNYKMYLSDLDTKIYIFYLEGHPVTFAIYNRIEHTDDFMLELIYTHSDYTTLGFATYMMRFAAKDLKERYNAKNIHTVVAKKNNPSLYLHKSFSKVDGVKTASEDCGSKYKFRFDISELKTNKSKSEESELII